MRHALTAEGQAFRLRPVVADDAALIVALRTDPRAAAFLHAGASTEAAQRAWISVYEDRPDDYYFIVERRTTCRPEGVIGLYGVGGGHGELGRWVMAPGSLGAPESLLLLLGIAFEALHLSAVYCRTVSDNASVLSIHDRYGAARTTSSIVMALADGEHNAVEHVLTAEQWPAAGRILGQSATIAARLLDR